MHHPKQFAQMESEGEKRRKTRSLRASLLKRGWLRENKQNGLTGWATERDGESAAERRGEGESVGKMTKWTERAGSERQWRKIGESEREERERRERERPWPLICLFIEKLNYGLTSSHSTARRNTFLNTRIDAFSHLLFHRVLHFNISVSWFT